MRQYVYKHNINVEFVSRSCQRFRCYGRSSIHNSNVTPVGRPGREFNEVSHLCRDLAWNSDGSDAWLANVQLRHGQRACQRTGEKRWHLEWYATSRYNSIYRNPTDWAWCFRNLLENIFQLEVHKCAIATYSNRWSLAIGPGALTHASILEAIWRASNHSTSLGCSTWKAKHTLPRTSRIAMVWVVQSVSNHLIYI